MMSHEPRDAPAAYLPILSAQLCGDHGKPVGLAGIPMAAAHLADQLRLGQFPRARTRLLAR